MGFLMVYLAKLAFKTLAATSTGSQAGPNGGA